MKNLSQVKDYPNYLKDMNTKAILNNNYLEFEEFKEKKNVKEKIHKLSLDYEKLRNDIDDIKNSLNLIIKSLSNK